LTLIEGKFAVGDPIRLGIIGGGQLGKMIAMEAKRMFMKVIVLDPNLDCPASGVADVIIEGHFSDAQKIYELSEKVDIVTYEIELANAKALERLEQEGKIVYPSSKALLIIQNKYRQKKFLRDNNINVPDFELVENEEQVKLVCKSYGFPVLLKACEDSYDGRGNYLINSVEEVDQALQFFAGRQCMLEKFVKFTKEISIMIARNPSGGISYFPVVENIHEDHILKTTIVPARINDKVKLKAIDLAVRTLESLGSAGIFGIEMFIDDNDEVMINEIAPRPHNSGHYSIEACSISQFEQHLRAILDLPMPKPFLLSDAMMVNILGPPGLVGPYLINGIKRLFSVPGCHLHIYGKLETKPKRKLGHITIVGSNQDPTSLRRTIDEAFEIELIQ
jgi:5-(carboxyamino)imidazole ribonucleotide synthase